MTMRACAGCGHIYAPATAPKSCPDCQGALMSVPIEEALTLARGRQDRLRAGAMSSRRVARP